MEVTLLGEKRALLVTVEGELDHHIAEKIKVWWTIECVPPTPLT